MCIISDNNQYPTLLYTIVLHQNILLSDTHHTSIRHLGVQRPTFAVLILDTLGIDSTTEKFDVLFRTTRELCILRLFWLYFISLIQGKIRQHPFPVEAIMHVLGTDQHFLTKDLRSFADTQKMSMILLCQPFPLPKSPVPNMVRGDFRFTSKPKYVFQPLISLILQITKNVNASTK